MIKPTNESGGYGILLGPKATREEHEKYRELIRANPRNYVAQPMLVALAGADRRSTTSSKAGTSTCGRTSCTARTSTCCPAD